MTASLSQQIREAFVPETILAALQSPVRAERALARDVLGRELNKGTHAEDGMACRRAVLDWLQNERSPAPLALEGLSTIAALGDLSVFESLVRHLDSSEAQLRQASSRVLARCFGTRCHELARFWEWPEVRYEMSFSVNAGVADALLQWYLQHGRTPEVAFGLLLTPDVLCELSRAAPAAATGLARQFGYLQNLTFREAEPLLAEGAWFVPDEAASNATRVTDFAQRARRLETLLATLLAGQGNDEDLAFDTQSPVELGLLCSAVRSCDHEVFLAQRFENHWRSQNLHNIRAALCKQAPHSFCCRVAIDEPLQLAGKLAVSPEQRGQFLLEYAAAQLPHDADERVERMAYLTSRWSAGSFQQQSRPGGWTFPVTQDADAPELKFHVVPAARLAPARGYLEAPSSGALAAARLLQVAGRADMIESLFFMEDSSAAVRSLGTEIQVPFLPERMLQSLPWKQALRAMGIPSPRRPEFRTMVEAAFPPSKSYHPQVLLPLLLERLGLFTERVDIALHLSFSGELGEEVRYLLFAQQFINEPKVHPAPQRLARLMSKGFARRHADALPVEGLRHDGRRTELRSYRFGGLGPASPQPLQRQFIDDIIETWLLIAARDADLPALQQVWRDYCECVAGIAASNAPEFNRLLESDWYESTEEPCDEEFTRKLPIVQAWNDLKAWLTIHNVRDEFRTVFKNVRTTAANRTLSLLPPGDVPASVSVQRSRCGAPFFDPGSASDQKS